MPQLPGHRLAQAPQEEAPSSPLTGTPAGTFDTAPARTLTGGARLVPVGCLGPPLGGPNVGGLPRAGRYLNSLCSNRRGGPGPLFSHVHACDQVY